MNAPESRLAPSFEPASTAARSPFSFRSAGSLPNAGGARPPDPPPLEPAPAADRAYWAGFADGLRRAGGVLPPTGDAGAPDGAAAEAGLPPDEPRDRLAFDPVPLRHRVDGLTPERQRAFVEALADCGIARQAAARVGVSEQAVSRVRRRADARSFDLACEAAQMLGARRLRSVAWERAVEGTVKAHYYRGQKVGEERVFDTRLLIYLLGKAEGAFAVPPESRGIRRAWEPSMEALEAGRPLPDPDEAAAPLPDYDPDVVVWWEDGRRWTGFPPPEGFDGEEQGEFATEDYQRTLSADEEAALDVENARALARSCAGRDRFFGLPPRGCPADRPPPQAETCETSEPSVRRPTRVARGRRRGHNRRSKGRGAS